LTADEGLSMPAVREDKKRQKGFAVIYVALIGAFVLIPMAGLAIDFGVVYNVKARLQTACDAAAIGAGYLLHATTNLSNPTQYNTVINSAQQFFNANYGTSYMGASIASYSASATSSTSGKTITVDATATVPMLFMRVLGIANSTVAAESVSNVRYIAMMIVVDRSGSVSKELADTTIQTDLTGFVADSSSVVVDGVDTVGMVSFGATWYKDLAPTTHFQTGSPSIGTAITNLDFNPEGGPWTSGTNTAEGLFQAWTQLYVMNLPGAQNVIVLLTDGRPSAFTASFPMAHTCNGGNNIKGNLQAYVGLGSGYPWWPPPGANNPGNTLGLLQTTLVGMPNNPQDETSELAGPNAGCQYVSNGITSVANDLASSNFPSTVGPVDSNALNTAYTYGVGTGLPVTTGIAGTAGGNPYYVLADQSANDPQSVRYAAFNAAYNMATLIRKDTTLSPMMFVIGLNYTNENTEPLDPDYLAALANDPDYIAAGTDQGSNDVGIVAGGKVFQTGQTPGMYCDSTPATLATCFAKISSALLRLIQ